MSNDPLAGFGTKTTPQQSRVPGRSDQVKNNAGGYVFKIDPLAQLRRFLIMGTAGGTYYVGAKELTTENGEMILALTEDRLTHQQLVDEIVLISEGGRAAKQNPALFALAIACQKGDIENKRYARAQINKVVRTGTHMFLFIGYLEQFGGWGRGLRTAVSKWFENKDTDKLSLQFVKYRQRYGWTHRDVLRKAHPSVKEPDKRAAVNWVVGRPPTDEAGELPQVIQGFQKAQVEGANIASLLTDYRLPWECLPDSAMNDKKVWDQMLDNGMPITALIRQLPRLTSIGMLPSMGGRTNDVVEALTNSESLAKGRVHPFSILVALKTYQQGHGEKGKLTWSPAAKIVDALDEAFYLAFPFVEPTGKRTMNCLDVSGSMGSYACGTMPLTAREASAAMAMVGVRTEPNIMTLGFTAEGGNRGYNWRENAELTVLPISARQRLDDVIRSVSDLPFGGTDCSLPMIHALHQGIEIDTFVIYTDNETWAGKIQPFQALAQYRRSMGIDARLVVVSMTPSHFSIADPKDPGMLDISGFDTAVPSLISDFSMGRV